MIFNSLLESEEVASAVGADDVDGLQNKDPETEEGSDNIAKEIETNMQAAALESLTYFDGGEEAIREFCQSDEAQVLVEARKMSKRTFVRLGKNDDLTRRKNMACLIIAREKKDPLFNKLALNRVKERQLRKAIFKKYGNMATRIAKKSQTKHIKDMKKMPPLEKFNPFK
jgi:hypothetical protein